MAKPKIDLKARLGRRAAGGASPGAAPAATGSIPPPVGVGQPAAPQQHHGGPFGAPQAHQPQPVAAPGALGVGAVQAPGRAAPAAAPVAFEMDEDFAAAQRGGLGKKVAAVAAAAGIVGGILGFAVGGMSEKDKVAQLALSGAQDLIKEIDAANAEAAKLSGILDEAAKTIKEGKYPEEQVKALGGINIPFDGTNLTGKAIGRFKPSLVTMLINYTETATKANDQKEKLQRVLTINQKGFEQLLAEKKNPTVRWGVYVQQGPQGPWANMQMLPASFPVESEDKKSPWPSSFAIQEGKKTYNLDRYMGGDLMRGGDAKIIPVAPQTQSAVCPTDTVVRLRRELSDMSTILSGDETPGREVQGLADLGETIKKQLAKIGG